MIDPIDLTMTGAVASRNLLGITEPNAPGRMVADFTTFRLVELQTSPIIGSFDSTHLRDIHRHLFQDIFDWAGELRGSATGNLPGVEDSLNRIFDRLARENYLKGFHPEAWAERVSRYVYDLGIQQPFLGGNDIALREFAAELASKNDLSLRWGTHSAVADGMVQLLKEASIANIRRLIMMAMDTNCALQHPGRGGVIEYGTERLLSLGVSHL